MLIELTLTSSSLSSPLVMILPVEGMVVSPKRYYVLRSPQSFSIEDKDGRLIHFASDILLEVFQGSCGQGEVATNVIVNGTKRFVTFDAQFREVSNYLPLR